MTHQHVSTYHNISLLCHHMSPYVTHFSAFQPFRSAGATQVLRGGKYSSNSSSERVAGRSRWFLFSNFWVKWDVGFGWFWAVNVVEHKMWSLDMFRNRFESKSACRWSWLEGPSFSGIVEVSCRKRCRIGQDFPNAVGQRVILRWGKPGGRWSNLSANPAQHSTPDILNLNWSVAVQNPWHSTRNCTFSPNIQNVV